MRVSSLVISHIALCAQYGSASFLQASNPPLYNVTGIVNGGQPDLDRKDEIGTTINEAARPVTQESILMYNEQPDKALVPILLQELNRPGRNIDRQLNAAIRKLESSNWTQLGSDIDGEAGYDFSGHCLSLSTDGKVLAVGAFGNDGTASSAGHVRVYSYTGTGWTQLGSDIDGEAKDDWSGFSISLSSDGKVLAVGAINNDGTASNAGHVRVYSYTGTGWTQLGSDIDGDAADDLSGRSVSLSSDGKVLAVGAPNNDGTASNAGHVRVYSYTGTGWTQLGSDIDGEAAGDQSGFSISLSSDGKVLAVGAPNNDGAASNAGHVRVYRYTGTGWTQLGPDISEEAVDDQSGWSVSLSSDGKVLAVGAISNDGTASSAGHVRVYRYTGTGWMQLGSDIDGEAADDQSGWSVSLSSDGKVLAIGAPYKDVSEGNAGHVRVYSFTGTDWTQLGSDIDGEAAGDQSGFSISLSSDGKVLAVGAISNDGTASSAGHVRVYSYTGTGWMQLGSDIDGDAAGDLSGHSVSLSGDGKVLAVGASWNDGMASFAGHVRVYRSNFLSTTSPSLSPSSMLQNFRDKSINSTCTLKSDTFWLNCSASTNVLVAGIFKTSLIQGNCSAGSPPTQESPISSIALDVNVDCKNSGTCSRTHCFRADYVIEGVSVLASMFEVVSTITFEKDGTFSVEVETSDFTATSEQTNTTVSATVTATLGECGSAPNSGGALEIGNTAVVCISSPDNVKLSLKSVTAKPGDQVLVNDKGEPNFLTTFNGGAQSVTLRTLMIPAYFDAQGGSGGSIVIEGTAEISYSARHLVSSRYLGEVEDALFGLEVPLIHPFDDQKIVQVNADEGNFGNTVRLGSVIPFVGAGAVIVMF